MNIWEIAAWVAAFGGFATAALFRKRASEVEADAKKVRELAGKVETFLQTITELESRRLSVVWDQSLDKWSVWRSYRAAPIHAKLVTSDENWSVAIQNAVHIERMKVAEVATGERRP